MENGPAIINCPDNIWEWLTLIYADGQPPYNTTFVTLIRLLLDIDPTVHATLKRVERVMTVIQEELIESALLNQINTGATFFLVFESTQKYTKQRCVFTKSIRVWISSSTHRQIIHDRKETCLCASFAVLFCSQSAVIRYLSQTVKSATNEEVRCILTNCISGLLQQSDWIPS